MEPNRSRCRRYVIIAAFLASCFSSPQSFGQSADSTVNKKRLYTFVIGSTVAYGATLYGLDRLWYKNSEKQSFRFFNDNAEWKQVDKLGHFFSSFYFSYGTSQALRWCNVKPKRADLVGALTGFLVLVPVEYFDGLSSAYGASAGDLLADAVGPTFFLTQKLLWKEIRLLPKFSFHRTQFAPLRPDVLGNDLVSEILKDYNGETFWLSVDMDKFTVFPKWLNLSVGYGANGMVYAMDGINKQSGFSNYRQYYLSLDLDLSSIRTRSKFVKTLIFIASTIKIPAPTLEFSRKRLSVHALYF